MAAYLCVPCAVGQCGDCHRTVVRGRVTRTCTCRHGAGRPPLAVTVDPRTAGGAMILDPGREAGVLLDTRHAVILDESTVSSVENPSDGRTMMAMFLEGRINRSTERTAILYLLGPDGAAALVTELVGLAARMGPGFEAEFREALDARMDVSGLWPSVVPAGQGDGS